MTSFTLLLSKKLFLTLKNFLLVLNSQKLSFGETPWLTGHHATPEATLFFYYHHVTYRTPCHASGHLVIYRECYRFQRAFFTLRRFFTLHSFLLISRHPWGLQFNLKVIRVSCWYFRNIAPAQLFVWITTIYKKVYSGSSI